MTTADGQAPRDAELRRPSEVAAESSARSVDRGYEWSAPTPVAPRPLAGTALWLAIAGLGVSLFVGWGFPLAVGAIVVAAVALRRAHENRVVAAWAIGLAAASLVYSAGWLVWVVTRL